MLLGRFALSLGETVPLNDLAGSTGNVDDHGDSGTATGTDGRYRVALLEKEPLYYTDLSVSYNPMIPVIYFGSVLFVWESAWRCIFADHSVCVVPAAEGAHLGGRSVCAERSTLTPGVERTIEALNRRER